ncbi:MAG TPA: Gfo/Idh/MocA family oxidoreductase [Abditibacterium sp.]|jgi:predicted dehydrogenase
MKKRVLQVGCGGITNAWFKAGIEFEDLEYVGLCDLNPEAAKFRIETHNLPPETPIFTNLKTALQELKPDAVFDCTIPAAHTPTALLSFEHGAHVLSEKPMAETLADAQKALDAAHHAGKIYAITQNYRYARGPRRLKAFLETQQIGAVTTINADMFLGPHFGGFRDQMEHVLLLDMAIHTFDMARFLSGADPISVFCHEWNPRGSWYARDASANAIFEMSDDVVYNFRGSWCATGLPTGFAAHWRIIGERGTVLWDGKEEFQIEVQSGDEGFFRPVETLEVPDADLGLKAASHGGVIRDFLDAIGGGEAPETRAADNVHSLAMVLGAVRSSESGEKVRLG